MKSCEPQEFVSTRHAARPKRATVWLWVGFAMAMFVSGCASLPRPELDARIQAASRDAPDDPAIQARLAEIEASRERERGVSALNEIEIRAGDEWDDEHEITGLVRVPIENPGAVRAQRRVHRAETEMAVGRLEEASLERRTRVCFPSVDALVHRESQQIYATYAERKRLLLGWSKELEKAGAISELTAARFEVSSRVDLVTRDPAPVLGVDDVLPVLPIVSVGVGTPRQSRAYLREAVSRHHPTVAVHRAAALRYQALVDRSRSRMWPSVRFIDGNYRHRAGSGTPDAYGGRVAFEVPFGIRQRADVGRYRALARQEESDARAVVEQQMQVALGALLELADFEVRAAEWRGLEDLATDAEEIARRWGERRLARPEQVADLLNEAFGARMAVLEARERAAVAGCTLLSMTGIPVEDWPRE